MGTIHGYLLLEALAFFAAALVHAGHLVPGYEHRAARIAETVLGLALLAGLVIGLLRPALTRAVGLAAQGFGLVGTVVGIFTIVVGIGPQSTADLIYHLAMVALLGWGLATAARVPLGARPG